MPKFSVRCYYTYVDEFEVEATSKDEAVELADDYQEDTEKITRIVQNEYVDHDDTCVSELDADGNWLEAI